MEKREKVLLGLMAVVGVVALLYFFVGGKGDEGAAGGAAPATGNGTGGPVIEGVMTDEQINAIIQEVKGIAAQPVLTVMEEAMLRRADSQWEDSPFYESKPGDVSEQANATFATHEEQSRFSVTGILMLGEGDGVAIINGWDYRVNDEILPGSPGYFITEITPDTVSIGRRDETTGEILTLLTLTMEEEDPFTIRDTHQ